MPQRCRHWSQNRLLVTSAAHGYCVGLTTPAELAGDNEQCAAPGRSTPAKLAGVIAVRSTRKAQA